MIQYMLRVVELSMSRDQFEKREDVLKRTLSERQLIMIGLGSAIGTGLFMGSSLTIHYAGPGVLFSYLLSSLIVLAMVFCLSRLSVAHPTAGSFGIHAEKYLGPWFGFVVRFTYWAANAIVIGGEATAIGVYMKYWFPDLPSWIWIMVFSLLIIGINAISVQSFGWFEYWFSTLKVVSIVGFILFGIALILGHVPQSTHQLLAHGGLLPHGWSGVWMGSAMAMFSFMGTEIIAITAGEAKNPKQALSKAMKWMIIRLVIFYLLSMLVMVCIVPWNQIGGERIDESPFVKVLQLLNIPYAAGVMNFIILTAALSTMNANLYACTRMIFSLSKSGYAPAVLGKVNHQGIPLVALLASSFGLGIAVLLNLSDPKAYNTLFGISIFGGIFTWIIIFLTYSRYRKKTGKKGSSLAWSGAALLVLVLFTMLLDPAWSFAIYTGIGWLVLITFAYLANKMFHRSQSIHLE
jgi:amino acid transporter, AAT family